MKYSVDHILVKHQYEAEDLLKKLESGESFSDLAKKYSTCGSASQGGALGEVEGRRLDADFEEALASLKVNEISKSPVRTRFGYHIIKRNS